MQFQKIGRVVVTKNLQYVGNTVSNILTYWWHNISKKLLIDFKILIQKDLNMPHIAVQYLLVEKDSTCHYINMLAIFLTRDQLEEYNILWEPFYIMPSQFIRKCCKQVMRYMESNKNQQMTPRKNAKMLPDYAATYPNAIIRYKARGMFLNMH